MTAAEWHNKLVDYQRDLAEVCADMDTDFPECEGIAEVCRRVGTGIDALGEMMEMGG